MTSSFVFKLLGEHAISTFPSELSFTVTCIFANWLVPIKFISYFGLIYLLLKNFINFYAIELIRKGFLIINLFVLQIDHLLFKYAPQLSKMDTKQILIIGLILFQYFTDYYTIEGRR